MEYRREQVKKSSRAFQRLGASPKSATGATVAIFSLWQHWPIEIAIGTFSRCAGFPAGARGFQPALVGILPAREKENRRPSGKMPDAAAKMAALPPEVRRWDISRPPRQRAAVFALFGDAPSAALPALRSSASERGMALQLTNCK